MVLHEVILLFSPAVSSQWFLFSLGTGWLASDVVLPQATHHFPSLHLDFLTCNTGDGASWLAPEISLGNPWIGLLPLSLLKVRA